MFTFNFGCAERDGFVMAGCSRTTDELLTVIPSLAVSLWYVMSRAPGENAYGGRPIIAQRRDRSSGAVGALPSRFPCVVEMHRVSAAAVHILYTVRTQMNTSFEMTRPRPSRRRRVYWAAGADGYEHVFLSYNHKFVRCVHTDDQP